MKRFLVYTGLSMMTALTPNRAGAQDDQFVKIYHLIDQADALNEKGDFVQALSRYKDATPGLLRLQKLDPVGKPAVISFRLEYLTTKISPLAAKVPAPNAVPTLIKGNAPDSTSPVPGKSAGSPAPAEVQKLQEKLRQLQEEKSAGEAKL